MYNWAIRFASEEKKKSSSKNSGKREKKQAQPPVVPVTPRINCCLSIFTSCGETVVKLKETSGKRAKAATGRFSPSDSNPVRLEEGVGTCIINKHPTKEKIP